MRQVFLHKGHAAVAEVPQPLLADHEVLVRVCYSFISSGTEGATMLASSKSLFEKFIHNATNNTTKVLGAIREHGFAGTQALIKENAEKILPLGYSCAGQVLAVGANVTTFVAGDYVACGGSTAAYHADVVAVPQQLIVRIKDPRWLKQASITTIGAIALQGIRRTQLQLGETVCVFGLGLIGQLTVQLAKQAGCYVIGIDIQEERLALAQKCGADLVLNAKTTNPVDDTTFATAHRGADATIITAASNDGALIQQAMLITRRKGRVVLVGDVRIDFDREPFYNKEIDFLISCSYGPGRYDATYEQQGIDYPYAYVRWTENRNMACFAELIERQQINIDPLISGQYDISAAADAYQSLQKGAGLGIVLSYESISPKEVSTKALGQPIPTVQAFTPSSETVNVGVVGVGGFAKIKLLPLLASLKQTNIHTIIDTNLAQAKTIANVYHAQAVDNAYQSLVENQAVKAVVIATPHAYHTQQAIDFLTTGKAVFVEKPAAVSFEQLDALQQFLAINDKSLFCVDFNRSFAPFVQDIKKVVYHRTNPLLITYRMNAGYLGTDHWIQSTQHRGRIVGEACHILELFCSLTDAQPVTIMASPLRGTTSDLLITDNFVATVTMSDGSCCSLTYTSLGDARMGKELMEIQYDGKSIVMRDFMELSGYGLPTAFNKKTTTQDKGHQALIQQFFDTVQGRRATAPIPVQRILDATMATLIVDQLVRQGGGTQHLTAEATSV
jgi:predicted dehydrogenase/threonine dehydrogenase-like Zn-dependent dehydrogenase